MNGQLYNPEDGILIQNAPAFTNDMEKEKTLRTLSIRAIAVMENMLPSSEVRRDCQLVTHEAGRNFPKAPYFWREGNIVVIVDLGDIHFVIVITEGSEMRLNMSVRVGCSTERASIMYTTDGTIPCEAKGQFYDHQTGIQMPALGPVTLHAVAFWPGVQKHIAYPSMIAKVQYEVQDAFDYKFGACAQQLVGELQSESNVQPGMEGFNPRRHRRVLGPQRVDGASAGGRPWKAQLTRDAKVRLSATSVYNCIASCEITDDERMELIAENCKCNQCPTCRQRNNARFDR